MDHVARAVDNADLLPDSIDTTAENGDLLIARTVALAPLIMRDCARSQISNGSVGSMPSFSASSGTHEEKNL
ncbi:hypothetical protein [Mesorhizobium onobrychidis]|uniref:Uncharacterized protein n=1 Tax=Mesorhizobium onobrychidis TaxID=2775404 RepID=A0ABY5QS44_9HYPH|nr:hypothetical protein [Mesorhizobium onobrychidis]UVC14005.1 hypothetical protein IHQ72_25445 [Mesorhizobium onobrychidis]